MVAVVVAALTLGGIGRTRFTPTTWDRLEHTWQQLGFWANSLIFLLAAMLVPRLIQTVSWEDVLMLAVLILVHAGRPLHRGLRPDAAPRHRPAGREHRHGLWRGHRLGRACAARSRWRSAWPSPRTQALPRGFRHIVAVLTTGFVLFTLLVNGISLRPLVKLLGLDRLPPAEQALRDRALNLALARIKDTVSEVAAADRLGPQPVGRRRRGIRPAHRRGEGRSEHLATWRSANRIWSLSGLRILANREGELALDKLEAGILPRSIADALIQGAGRLGDAAKVGGRAGYEQAAAAALGFPVGFRIALLAASAARASSGRWPPSWPSASSACCSSA